MKVTGDLAVLEDGVHRVASRGGRGQEGVWVRSQVVIGPRGLRALGPQGRPQVMSLTVHRC